MFHPNEKRICRHETESISSGTLKPTVYLPPLLALVIVAGWIGNGRRTISMLEEESAVLRTRLSALSSQNSEPDNTGSKPDASAKSAKDKEPINWKKMAVDLAAMKQDDMGGLRTKIRLQQQIQAMSKEELVSALDEIATLDLPDEQKAIIEGLLIGPLCKKDPELALTRFVDRLNDESNGISWQLSYAMKQWAGKDLTSATAWFDQQIAAGKFDSKALDGKSRPRMQFEGMLIASMVSSDPDAASARIAALPEDQRAEVLRSAITGLEEKNQLDYANLIRKNLPASEQAKMLAQQAGQLTWRDGYTGVTEYLDRIQATPDERVVCVEKAAEQKFYHLSQGRKITGDDIDAMREWAATQSSGSTDKLTGSILANASRTNTKLDFSEAADLALKYNQASGNDDVLVSFLGSGSVGTHIKEARALAQRISDPTRREEILKKLK